MDVVLEDRYWEGVPPEAQALLDAWHAEPGAHLRKGDPLARVVLVKTVVEIDAPADGTLEAVLVPAAAQFSRGQALARIREG